MGAEPSSKELAHIRSKYLFRERFKDRFSLNEVSSVRLDIQRANAFACARIHGAALLQK